MGKAFAFDIDGVLLRGSRVIPGARKALELLNRRRIPWILLTNGGGKTERDRVSELSNLLKLPINEGQFLQSHTPFKDFVGTTDRVLVVGGKQEACREIAKGYGFKDVVVTKDIVGALPTVQPFPSWTSTLVGNSQQVPGLSPSFDINKPFDAIFVFHDTYDMSVDSQIVTDLLLSEDGRLGTRKDPARYESKPTIPIHFSNADLEWATDFSLPRFGQGAFIQAVTALYTAVTRGKQLTHTVIGKPTTLTYQYAHRVLEKWAANQGDNVDKVFMIGDNQNSDIMGANNFGWESVLVRSGVYKDGDALFTKPTYIEDDVLAAVERVLEN